MNKVKTRLTLFTGCLLWVLSVVLSGILSGHDPTGVTPGISTSNYQNFFIVFPQFAIGTSGSISYTSILQITNTNREKQLEGKIKIHGTSVQGQAAPFIADYTVNKDPRFSGRSVIDVVVAPLGTTTVTFESEGPLRVGFIELNPRGDRKDDVSTSFFFQIHDVQTGELIDSVGVPPSDFGWRFSIPVIVNSLSAPTGTNTGIAYSHIPVSQDIQIIFELRDSTGKQLAFRGDFLTYRVNALVYPYHRALFATDIFAGYFAERERQAPGRRDTFRGSLHIYAQRNINVMAIRVDIRRDGNVQLTSVPSDAELCIDGPNQMDNCFEEATRFPIGWVPVRNKSPNEIWLEDGGVCDEAGVCSP